MPDPLPPADEDRFQQIIDSRDYENYVLKDYACWRLSLNLNQCYFGRAVLWLTTQHIDRHHLGDLTADEISEFISIVREYEAVCTGFGASTVNCCWLGNLVDDHRGHGHWHLIPRYDHGPIFDGRIFDDPNVGRNYAPYPKLDLSRGELLTIRDYIREQLA